MAWDPLGLAQELISFESPSRVSNVAVSDRVQALLEQLGFEIERLEYRDAQGVPKANVIGRAGPGKGGMAYFGHTDVVPADDWSGPGGAFAPTVAGDRLYGRGACDMKGSVACMLAAASRVDLAALSAPLYVACTADEEVGYGGAREVAARSRQFREMIDGGTRGIIGEPTSLRVVHAHKGTAGFTAVSHGQSAHSSSRLGRNANLAMIPFLAEMKAIHDELESDPHWHDAEFDPPTVSWNIGVNDHTSAINVKAPQSVCTVYFRPMPGQDAGVLLDRARAAAQRQGLEFVAMEGAGPLRAEPGSPYIVELLGLAGQDKPLTVCYGTDGGVLRELPQLAVVGPGDIAQAHTADEWIALQQLEAGADFYERLIRQWCCP